MAIEPGWLTVGDAQKYAGCKKTSLYKALNGGLIEARHAFGRTLIKQASIDAYIESCRRVGSKPQAG